MSDARVTDLEVRYSYLEDLVEQLSDLVRDQADQIGRLEKTVRDLKDMIDQAGLGSDIDPGHHPPPHY